MNNYFRTYCDEHYLKTGQKFYWHLKSCCLDISLLSEDDEFNHFTSSTAMNDSDILVIGAKISQSDVQEIKQIERLEDKKIILFGNCALNGGIFSLTNSPQDYFGVTQKNFLFIPGCPPSFDQFVQFFEDFFKR